MGGLGYIPNPPGTLPYKPSSFGTAFEQVAQQLEKYFEIKKQGAQQKAQQMLQLAQTFGVSDPKALSKAVKEGYGISLTPEVIKTFQESLKSQRELQTRQQTAQTE